MAVDEWIEKGDDSKSGPVSMFLAKVKAVTSSMSHTKGASMRARQKIFAMMTRFGLATAMFTITPDDNFNYRIKIMSMTDKEIQNYSGPPDIKNKKKIAKRQMPSRICH